MCTRSTVPCSLAMRIAVLVAFGRPCRMRAAMGCRVLHCPQLIRNSSTAMIQDSQKVRQAAWSLPFNTESLPACSSLAPTSRQGIQRQQTLAAPGLGVLVDVGKGPQRPPPVSAQEAQLPSSHQGAQGYHVCIVVVLHRLKS